MAHGQTPSFLWLRHPLPPQDGLRPWVTTSLALWPSASAWGQWSTDPQKKHRHRQRPRCCAALTADGHWWLSWFGLIPRFVLDGRGGAIFAWYSIDPQIQVFAQHVQANGSTAFAHNGVAVPTHPQQARTDPAITYQPATGETTLFWTELDSAERQRGVYAQKRDARGARQ